MNPDQKEVELKKQVLSRTRSIFYMRTVVRPFFMKLGLFAISVAGISFLVSIPSIVANMRESQAVAHYAPYLFSALVHTRTVVQIALASVLILLGFVIRDVFKVLAKSPRRESLSYAGH